MLFRSRSLVIFSVLLSGCSIMPLEQHRQTLSAIQELEKNVQHTDSAVKEGLAVQLIQIDSLNQQLNAISEKILNIKISTEQKAQQISQELPLAPEQAIVCIEKEIPVVAEKGKTILGELEWLWFDAINTNFRARIDTGATTSSLNASDIQEYERDGKTWVRFKLAHLKDESDATEPESTIEAPVKRWVKIRQVSSELLERRPVVELRIRLGKINEKTQFTLADRSHMEFPVLLGRDFFKDIAVIDVAQSYIYPKFMSDKK